MMVTSETKALLRHRLELVFDWYKGMVNPSTDRLEYLYLPEHNKFVRENCPIRDIASIWDMELLSDFLHRSDLHSLINTSLRYYLDWLIELDDCLIFDSTQLDEPSSIAHSAFMLLALLRQPQSQRQTEISKLAEGILRQQRPDGSYKVHFERWPDTGEELYSGEAMLALVEYYRASQDTRYIESVARGLEFYDVNYFRSGRVRKDLLVFFANWQSQAARVFVESVPSAEMKTRGTNYLFRLHDKILDHGFYQDVQQHPERQVSVEVACALEGLNDSFAVAKTRGDKRVEPYRDGICIGLRYLVELQSIRGCPQKACGGFGLALSESAQRVDISGHAASALMKILENEIDCEE